MDKDNLKKKIMTIALTYVFIVLIVAMIHFVITMVNRYGDFSYVLQANLMEGIEVYLLNLGFDLLVSGLDVLFCADDSGVRKISGPV